MNNTRFGAIHYDIHLDKKLDCTIIRIFQEMSLTELEILHQLCQFERTQILQSLAPAKLKIPYAGYLLFGNRSNFIEYEGNTLWYYTCTKKVPYTFLKTKDAKEESLYTKKIKVNFVDTLSRNLFLGYSSPIWIRKQPQCSTVKP